MLKELEIWLAKLSFSQKVRNRTYKKLNRFLSNGIPLMRALDILWGHASDEGRKPKESLAIVMDAWRRQVAEGRSLGSAIKGWVPESDRIVIEGGDKAGNLMLALEKAIAINESSGKIRNTVIKGLAYPLTLIAATIGLLVVIVRQVVPAFDQVLPQDRWTGLGAQLATVAYLVDNYLIYFLAFLAAVITTISVSMPRWTSRLRTKLDKYPPWSLYRLVMGSGFMLTVAGMLRAGIPLPTILGLLQRGAPKWYRTRIRDTLRWVDEGFNLGEALHKSGYDFPDKESVKDLRAYASLNKFDEALDNIGTEWLEESVQKIEVQTAFLKNFSFLLLAGTIIWIYWGMLSLQQQISSSLQ